MFKLKWIFLITMFFTLLLCFINFFQIGQNDKLYSYLTKPKQIYITNFTYITNEITIKKLDINEYEILYKKTEFLLKNEGSKIPKYLSEIITNVIKYGNENNIDYELILSIIYIESSFNKNEHNSYGATGLMQIVPKFLENLCKTYHISKSEVYDIDNNIFMGTTQLKWFLKDSNGSLGDSLYRYNGNIIRKISGNKVSISYEGYRYLIKILNVYYYYKNLNVNIE
jgi:hypothetical protein